ncbi:MAG: phytoene desaturase family protein [bacterium]|nr:phytoene desaturase family protein [bacterium]
MKKNIFIIGAGFGGLSAAALAAKKGYKVRVIDKNQQVGGRSQVLKKDGFTFDMGPSWYLMPDVFDRFFSYFGKQTGDYYKLKRISPNYRLFFEDGGVRDVPSDIEGIYSLFDELENNGAEKLKKFLAVSSYQYRTAIDKFLYRKYDSLLDVMDFQLIKDGIKLNIFSSIDSFVNKYFDSVKARQILEYTMVFLGASPYNTPALYSIMSHVDFDLGVWYPEGGFNAVAKGYESLAKEHGANIETGVNALKIVTDKGRVRGVETSRGFAEADIVISNADYYFTEMNLIDRESRSFDENFWNRKIMGPSAFLLYIGTDKKVETILHHNLYLAENWKEHFDTIFKQPSMPSNPSYYISATSKTDDTAPGGCENVFVLVPIASGIEDNEKIRAEYSDKIIKHMSKILKFDFESHMKVKEIFSINDFMREYNSYKGTALGLSHAFMQTALFRLPYGSKKIKGLFYTGHYTHPGIGIPMVTISSEVLVDSIEKIYG